MSEQKNQKGDEKGKEEMTWEMGNGFPEELINYGKKFLTPEMEEGIDIISDKLKNFSQCKTIIDLIKTTMDLPNKNNTE